jgi:hypothetical protein
MIDASFCIAKWASLPIDFLAALETRILPIYARARKMIRWKAYNVT